MSYLQPHEGITGTARSAEDPLLTPVGSDLVLQLTRHLYGASISTVPSSQELHRRLTSPAVGQPVAVLDAMYQRSPDTRWKGVGYLLETRREWWTTDAEWAAEQRAQLHDGYLADEERMVEPAAWYVQYGPEPADVCRWVNCQVLALPLEWAP